MKTNLFKSALAFVAFCSALNLKAENNLVTPRLLIGEIPLSQVTAVTPVNGDTVTPGNSRIMVSMRLGSPSKVLADGSWLYSGYTTKNNPDCSSQSGTLVIRFTSNKVSSLTLADKASVIALRAARPYSAKDQLLAVNQGR